MCVWRGRRIVYIHNVKNNKLLHTLDTKTVRIKGLCVCPSLQKDDSCKKWLCICSSDGHVKLYRISELGESFTTDLLAEHSTSFRLTCLAVYVKDTASHTTEEDSETAGVENSERTDQVKKKKNRKRKSVVVEERTDVVEKEREVPVDTEIPKSKKLKKSDTKEEHSELKQKKKIKKDKNKSLKRKEQIIGEGKTTSPKKKNKKKKKKLPA